MSRRAPTRPGRPGGGRGRPSPAPARRPFPLLPVAAGLVALLAAVVIAIGALGDGDDGTREGGGGAETQPVEVTGSALPPFAEGGSDAAVGMTAPEIRGSGFDGEPVAVTNDGRPRLVAFLAHWCPHCRTEVPVVVDWLGGRAPEGVDLVAVSTSVDEARPNYPPSAWLAREGWAYPTIADSDTSESARAYGLTGFPYFVAVDAAGNVAARAAGALTVAQLEGLLAAARG